MEADDGSIVTITCHTTLIRHSDIQHSGQPFFIRHYNNNIINTIIGLGVRRVASLAIPAFIASAASTLSLQDDLLTIVSIQQACHYLTIICL